MQDFVIRLGVIAFVVSMIALGGCGGSDFGATGEVSGVVTLDGVPLEGALVDFSPEKGRGSSGVTDVDGRYKLMLMGDRSGAVVGKHQVRITNQKTDEGGSIVSKSTIPAKFNQKTTLSATVEAKSQEINFDLKSK